VKKAGRRLRTEHLEVRASDSLLSHARAAVIVGKHGHTIVERNRLRRRLRELVRVKILSVLEATDIVVRAFPSAYERSFADLSKDIDEIMRQLQQRGAVT
jgi:ribonuclease P protein component